MVQRPGTAYDPSDKTKLLKNNQQYIHPGYAGYGHGHPGYHGYGYGGYGHGGYGHPGYGYGGYGYGGYGYGHPGNYGHWNGGYGDLRDGNFYPPGYRYGSPTRPEKVKVKAKDWNKTSKVWKWSKLKIGINDFYNDIPSSFSKSG